MKWYFQTVHHGLWDYDMPAQPNLVTITVNGRRIDAVAQVTKQGFTFVFDRVTGTPVWPIDERPVPTDSDIPGEKVSRRSRFPEPPAFVGRAFARGCQQPDAGNQGDGAGGNEKYQSDRSITPPVARGTLQRPELYGGANWGGLVDPESATCTCAPITRSG